jgi:4a-hydroxytetrahydrobiopterin dehydratase
MSSDNSKLTEKKCIPCSGAIPRLRGKEIESFFEQLEPGWKVKEERHLEKEYHFPDFRQALDFTNEIGMIAEAEGHHPDVYLAWGKVKLILWTHKINGLSESDFILAAKCDEKFKEINLNKDF